MTARLPMWMWLVGLWWTPPTAAARTCPRCGCPRACHEHYRPGTDCGYCGAGACGRYLGRLRGGLWLAAQAVRLLSFR